MPWAEDRAAGRVSDIRAGLQRVDIKTFGQADRNK